MQSNTWQDALRTAVPAGLLAGAAMGIIARISMRVFALATGEPPTFSLGGTTAVIAVFALVLGLPLSVIYVRYWRPMGLAEGWHGAAYGAAIFVALVAIPFLVIPSDEANLHTRLLAIASFVPVPLAYGYVLGLIVERLIGSS